MVQISTNYEKIMQTLFFLSITLARLDTSLRGVRGKTHVNKLKNVYNFRIKAEMCKTSIVILLGFYYVSEASSLW